MKRLPQTLVEALLGALPPSACPSSTRCLIKGFSQLQSPLFAQVHEYHLLSHPALAHGAQHHIKAAQKTPQCSAHLYELQHNTLEVYDICMSQQVL
jgi:hypothetical protein